MKPSNKSAFFYAPANVPSDPALLPDFLYTEFRKLQAAMQLIADGHLDKSYAAPSKPRDGDIRYANGSNWDPGSGAGIYYYNGTTWKFLG